MRELTIDLELNKITPLYEQIYEYIRDEIKNGRIGCKSKLPSTRSLALHLQVSRSTVDLAYAQLVSEGYVEAVPCRGYFVNEVSLLYNISGDNFPGFFTSSEKKEEKVIDFSPWGIDLDSFPFNTWRKLSKNILSFDNKELFASGDSKGDYLLRKTICDYLYEARGVNCTPDKLIVGAGNEHLLMILCQLIGKKKHIIAMEDPTYMQAYGILSKSGSKIVPISLDNEGIDIQMLKLSGADMAYVMPSHQFPLGSVMPIRRRLELLKWAEQIEERYIIEDDYDSEFRYKGKPIPALQGVDRKDKVIYLGTFSKSIAPAIRMSYMILPDKMMKIYESSNFYTQTVSRIDQMVVSDFICEGYFERHLNKMRSVYKNKHDILMNELKPFRKNITLSGENSGLHILLTINNGMTEDELVDSAMQNGIKIYGISRYFINVENNQYLPTILVGFAQLEEKEIREGIRILMKAWKIC